MGKGHVGALCALCTGFLFSGIAASLYVSCALGSDAFTLLTQGAARTLDMQVGNAFYLIQGVILVFLLAVQRRQVGLGTLLGTFLIGLIMNLWSLLLTPLLETAELGFRLCCLAAAPAFTGMGISLVKRSGYGLVPCDILTVILHEPLRRLQFRTVRMLCDGTYFLLGLRLGGTAGIGTVLSVLLTGPCIQLASSLLDRVAERQRRRAPDPGYQALDNL